MVPVNIAQTKASALHKFYRLIALQNILARSAELENLLWSELVTIATDDVLFHRRVRMIHQLGNLKSQAIGKLRTFQTNDPADFTEGVHRILAEFDICIDRNS